MAVFFFCCISDGATKLCVDEVTDWETIYKPGSYTHFHVLKVSSTNCHEDTLLLLRLGGIKTKVSGSSVNATRQLCWIPTSLYKHGAFVLFLYFYVNAVCLHRLVEITDILGNNRQGFTIYYYSNASTHKMYCLYTHIKN